MGSEEDARVILGAMFDRIIRGPHIALDVDADAPAVEIRGAFHVLAKQYHPARFGRMSPETQRLANEVFLGIRTAHDTLMKAATRQSTNIGVGIPARGRHESTQPPPVSGRAVHSSQPPQQPLRPIAPAQRPSQPISIQRPPSGGFVAQPQSSVGSGPRALPNQSGGSGARPVPQRPPQQGVPRSVVGAPIRPTPPGPLPLPSAAGTAARQTAVNPTVARTQTEPRVDGIRIAGTRPPHGVPTAATMQTNHRIAAVLDMLARGQWDAARSTLSSLVAEIPESTQARALLSYAAGRQAQIEKRLDEARVELQRALQLDPDLTLAKTALAELFARRK